VILSYQSREASLFRHRDGNSVTANPFDSLLTNCDACNPFRMCFYENTGVSVGPLHRSNIQTCQRAFYLSSFFSNSCALFCATARLYHPCFHIFAHSFYHDGGCTPLVLSPRLKMNRKIANSNASNVSLRCHQPSSTHRHGSSCPRFASRLHNCLADYLDWIFLSADPVGHFPHSTQRSGSRA
jgi:hypothetical protein